MGVFTISFDNIYLTTFNNIYRHYGQSSTTITTSSPGSTSGSTSTSRNALYGLWCNGLCGIDDVTQFDGKTAAQRFTEDVFDESFDSCMDKTFTDLEADFKSYASMTLAQGQLRFYQESKTKWKLSFSGLEIKLGWVKTQRVFHFQFTKRQCYSAGITPMKDSWKMQVLWLMQQNQWNLRLKQNDKIGHLPSKIILGLSQGAMVCHYHT